MKLNLLYELKKETERIYVKGTRTARNNIRISKALPVLMQYKHEDPVYDILIFSLESLISPYTFDYPEVLANVYIALNYLLRRYGEPMETDEQQTELVPAYEVHTISTIHSYSEMNLLIRVLSGKGENRLEVLRKAQEDNLFNDFRIYPFLDKALGDQDAEVAGMVEDIIRNVVGDKLIPFLVNHFENNNKSENQRRLNLLYAMHYEGMDELIDEILEGNATLLQAKVIDYISNDPRYEDRILAFADHSQKALREIAYKGLAQLKTEKRERKLLEIYTKALRKRNKSELEIITEALSLTDLQYIADEMLDLSRESFNTLLKAGKKADGDLFHQLRMSIHVLAGNISPDTLAFFEWMLLHNSYGEIIEKKVYALEKPAISISNTIVSILEHLNPIDIVGFCNRVINYMPESKWKLPFYKLHMDASIRRGVSSAIIYDTFVGYYEQGYITEIDLMKFFGAAGAMELSVKVDMRWADKLYETMAQLDKVEHVEALFGMLELLDADQPERFNKQLIKAGQVTKKYLPEVTTMIMNRNLPDKYELVYQLVKHCHDQGASGSNTLRQLSRATYWEEYPEGYANKFKQLKNLPQLFIRRWG